MILMTPTKKREEIIAQFPITDRDNHVYKTIYKAVEDALRRSFKDINFRTMTATAENIAVKRTLEKINGPRKISKFDIETVKDQCIKDLIKKLNNEDLAYDDCTITEYLILQLINKGFINRFIDYFNCNTYKSEKEFDGWHEDTAGVFLSVLEEYYDQAYYGKAQKIVNMMFKHLYCMNFGKEDEWKVIGEDYFTHCHMPLDSFTLDWLHRKDGEAICEWSNLVNVSYKKYVGRVRTLFRTQFPSTGLTPFQGEFFIWPQMLLTQTLESIYRLNNHSKADVEAFIGKNITKKCSIIVSEISGKSFSTEFI